jgi:large subunit ribosomal protein L6
MPSYCLKTQTGWSACVLHFINYHKMSNIGKIQIVLPSNLDVKVKGWKIFVKGPFGEKTISLPIYTRIQKTYSLLSFRLHNSKPENYGSMQRKLHAFLYGMAYVYTKRLLFVGVGYRARQEGQLLVLRLGYSHEISLSIPSSLGLRIVKRNNLILTGSSYEEISQFAYRLRSFRRPEPFKGKGIVCLGEVVRRKEGKKKKL